ncbi:MAG: DUF523 and DUF1722 domain-containing protein [bacterium]
MSHQNSNAHTQTAKIRLGVSTCLLGENVRFDGGHKHDQYLTGTLGKFVEWVPVCPEVEIGLGTPRESLHLAGDPEAPRLVTTKTNRDYTDAMLKFAHAKMEQLRRLHLNGYILKKDSPSCGMERVRVYLAKGMPARNGVGLYARVLIEQMPHLPIEEEGRLNDPKLRENFKELQATIENYRTGLLPLVVPMTLIKHYLNKFEVPYIQNQVYLHPHPKELMLLNHVWADSGQRRAKG